MEVSNSTCLSELKALWGEPVSQVTLTKDAIRSAKYQGAKVKDGSDIGILPGGEEGRHRITKLESEPESDHGPGLKPKDKTTIEHRNLAAVL